MPNPSIVRFDYDPTGVNPDNLVSNEIHALTDNYVRAFAPTYGPFFADSVVLFDNANDRQLVRGVDYSITELNQDITLRLGKEVSSVMLVLHPSVSNVVRMTYQVVGGLYQNQADAIANMYNTLLQDGRPIEWANILGKPLQFPPTLHLHNLEDVYGFEPLVNAIERIRSAIILSDVPAFEALIDWIMRHLNDCCAGEVDARVAADNNLSDAILQEINNRGLGDSNLLALLQDEILARIAGDNELRALIGTGGGGGQPYANTPIITTPVNNSVNIPLTQIFTCSMDSSGITIGAYFQWQIANNSGFLSSGTTGDGKGGTIANTMIAQTTSGTNTYAPSGLTNSEELYIRVRYVHPSPSITTAWSSVIHCTTVAANGPRMPVQALSLHDFGQENTDVITDVSLDFTLNGDYLALGGCHYETSTGRNSAEIQVYERALTTNISTGQVQGNYYSVDPTYSFLSHIFPVSNNYSSTHDVSNMRVKMSNGGSYIIVSLHDNGMSIFNTPWSKECIAIYNTSRTAYPLWVSNQYTTSGFDVYDSNLNSHNTTVFSEINSNVFYAVSSRIDSEVKFIKKDLTVNDTPPSYVISYPNLTAVPTNSGFGTKLGINDVGDRVVVAAPRDINTSGPGSVVCGSVYIYTRSGAASTSVWTLEQKLIPTSPVANDNFGDSVGINHDGSEIFVTKYPVGSVPLLQMFKKNGSNIWTKTQEISFADFVDHTDATGSLSVYFADAKFKDVEFIFSIDGAKAMINFNSLHRSAYLLNYNTGSWQLMETLTLPNQPAVIGNPALAYPGSMELATTGDFSTIAIDVGDYTTASYADHNRALIYE
jgi:hypothetical protein